MSALFWILIAVHVILCVVLVALVLLQNDKAGGLAGAFGGGGANSAFSGGGASTFIQKLTRGVAISFMVVVFAINFTISKSSNTTATGDSQIKKAAQEGLGSIVPDVGTIKIDSSLKK